MGKETMDQIPLPRVMSGIKDLQRKVCKSEIPKD
jgi:hypothetical protein